MSHQVSNIHTPHLVLIASTVDHLRIELDAPSHLGEALGAEVPSSWPPGLYDRDAMQFFLEQATLGGNEAIGWFGWYAIRPATENNAALLVASGGYCGPPSSDGTVEIGYSVVEEERRKGYATEIVNALVARALAVPQVTRVVAEVHEDNGASIAVLRRSGFVRIGPGRDDEHFRYEYFGASAVNRNDS